MNLGGQPFLAQQGPAFLMGSVGPNHICPMCGRVGMGGYAMDGINCGPICTVGNFSCLWYQVLEHGHDYDSFRVECLRAILRRHKLCEVLPSIVEWL